MTRSFQNIVVVDDDAEIRDLLTDYLGRHGFTVLCAQDAQALEPLLDRVETIDLFVVDIMLPGDDGFAICRRVRERGATPVIMLTASDDEADCIASLELGADDFLAKPFNPRELVARIKAVLRRAHQGGAAPETARVLRFGEWRLDRVSRELIDREGGRQPLSGADFLLLSVFLEHPEQVLSREHLYDLSRGRQAPPLDRSIDVHVCRLRRRLGAIDARQSELIRTVRGAGYVLAAPVEAVE